MGPVKGADEFRALGASFDQMADYQDRQEELLRNMIADISHELRTPAAVLVAGQEALLDRVEEPTPGQLASLRDEAMRLSGMIDDLHDRCSRARAGPQRRYRSLQPARPRTEITISFPRSVAGTSDLR